MKSRNDYHSLPKAKDAVEQTSQEPGSLQAESSSYTLSFADTEFLVSDELRGVRLMLEYMKPESLMREENIESTVVVFGSARIPSSAADSQGLPPPEQAPPYYDEARRFGRLMSEFSEAHDPLQCVIMTGGGPGIMEAANRGASDANAKNIGLNIVLPREQLPNTYSTPELTFQFHYFALRKLHFLLRAQALVVFPGGFGTLDELFETLALLQTRRIAPIPVLLFGQTFWERVVNFQALVDDGMIAASDLNLFQYVDSAEQAVDIIARHMDSRIDSANIDV